jgi:hypothetical protein
MVTSQPPFAAAPTVRAPMMKSLLKSQPLGSSEVAESGAALSSTTRILYGALSFWVSLFPGFDTGRVALGITIAISHPYNTKRRWICGPAHSVARTDLFSMLRIVSSGVFSCFFRVRCRPSTGECEYVSPLEDVSLRRRGSDTSPTCRPNTAGFPLIDTEILHCCRKLPLALGAFFHNVAPAARPKVPSMAVPPPKMPALVKKLIEPAKMVLKGLSINDPT